MALQDHQRALRDYARRVRDSHRLQMQSLGAEPGATSDQAEDDSMGDIFVCGDITSTAPAAHEPAAAPPAPYPTAGPGRLLPYILAAVLAGGGLGVGAALPALVDRLTTSTPTTAAQAAPDISETQWELRISSGDQGK